MYYFIPAWYGQTDEFWKTSIDPWYLTRQKIEFDDSLHQVRIFQDEELTPQLLLLAYQPHLRYFLHRHDVLEVKATAIFDLIQGISDEAMRNLQVTDLDWPEGSTFVYTPFAIVVQCQHKRYAEIEFGTEGFIAMIRYFDEEQIIREDVYDDRGFVSSSLYFENGQPIYRNYLNAKGIWQLCHFFDGRGIVANPRTDGRFNKSYYGDLSEVIWEFLDKFLAEKVTNDDRFVIASDLRHNKPLFNHLPTENTKILTWFAERNQDDSIDAYAGFLSQVDLLIADRYDYLEQLQVAYPEETKKLKHMASFDTRLALGTSQRVKESKIFYQVDLNQLDLEAIYQVLAFVAKYPKTRVEFGAFNANPEQLQNLEHQVEKMIDERFSSEVFEEVVESSGAENRLEENNEIISRFSFQDLRDETALIKSLQFTRLIVDLSKEPNRYTQIAGISAGIPQINRVASEYVTHQENGYILKHLSDFEKGAYYYLGQLNNWNRSLIYSIEKIKENTGDRLVQKWENWLKEEQHGQG